MDAIVRARTLTGFGECVRSLGGDPEGILNLAGLDARQLGDPNRWISFRAALRAYEIASEMLDEPAFGVKLVEYRDFTFLGPLLLCMRYAETVKEAWIAMARYLGIQNTGFRVVLSIGETTVQRSYHMSADLRRHADQWIEETLLASRRLLSQVVGEETPIQCFRVKHGPLRPEAAYAGEFGAPVFFGQDVDAAELDREVVERRLPSHDAATQGFVMSFLDERVISDRQDVETATRNLLEALIPLAQGKLEIVAEHLHLHPRTLQRRLLERGYSFTALLDEQRRRLAEGLLKEGNLPLVNVAHLLGYAEQSAFNHAFERWHGMPPRRWTKAR